MQNITDHYKALSVEDCETIIQCLHNYGTRHTLAETIENMDCMRGEGFVLVQFRANKWWIKQRSYLPEKDQITIDYLTRFFAV